MAPAILGYGPYPSTHRMLMAFPFIALSAACALNLRRRLRQLLQRPEGTSHQDRHRQCAQGGRDEAGDQHEEMQARERLV